MCVGFTSDLNFKSEILFVLKAVLVELGEGGGSICSFKGPLFGYGCVHLCVRVSVCVCDSLTSRVL